MLGDEMTPDDAAIELSDEDLEDVAGGFDMRIRASRFKQSSFSPKRDFGRVRSSGGDEEAQTIESDAVEIVITDATTEDLQVLGGFLRNFRAIDDDD